MLRPRSIVRSGAVLAVILGLIGFVIFKTQTALNEIDYRWHWEKIPVLLWAVDPNVGSSPGLLLKGLWLTLKLSFIAAILSLILGFVIGIGRVLQEPIGRAATRVYVEVVRGTPLLVQIYVIYFLIGTAFGLTSFWAGITALSLFNAAYIAEIVRGGIDSIDTGQTEASNALGFTWLESMILIILPQAGRRMIPPLTGQMISLIKDSSLVSVISLTELTLAGKVAASSNFITMEVWITVAVLYFSLTFPLSLLSRSLETRLSAQKT